MLILTFTVDEQMGSPLFERGNLLFRVGIFTIDLIVGQIDFVPRADTGIGHEGRNVADKIFREIQVIDVDQVD